MDQAAGDQLEPAGSVARGAAFAVAKLALEIQLKPRLDEREEALAQTHGRLVVENLAQERLHDGDQVRDGNIFIDHQPLALVESILVARVHRLVAEAASRENGAERNAQFLHRADLVRRGVRTHEHLILEPVRVLHFARRVVRRNVHGVEIIKLQLTFRRRHDREAHPLENRFKLHLNERDRVQGPERTARSGKGEVQARGLLRRRGVRGGLFRGGEGFFRKVFQFVQLRTKRLLFLDGEGVEVRVFGQVGDGPFLAEVLDSYLLDRVSRLGGGKVCRELFFKCLHWLILWFANGNE